MLSQGQLFSADLFCVQGRHAEVKYFQCEFADLVSLLIFLCLVNIVQPVIAIFADLIIRDLMAYTSALVIYCMGFPSQSSPVQLTNNKGDWQWRVYSMCYIARTGVGVLTRIIRLMNMLWTYLCKLIKNKKVYTSDLFYLHIE